MGFMNVTSDEVFKVYVGFNAKAGRWYTKKDGKDDAPFKLLPIAVHMLDPASVEKLKRPARSRCPRGCPT